MLASISRSRQLIFWILADDQRMKAHVCRHYSDAVLVAVIALCTLENDVIHAGYLALALYFFRQRESLRTPALFRWLPLYNFGVMLLSLAYQAPLQNLWHGTPHRQVQSNCVDANLECTAETCCFAAWTASVSMCNNMMHGNGKVDKLQAINKVF